MIDFSGYTAKSIEKDMLSQVRETIDIVSAQQVERLTTFGIFQDLLREFFMCR